jgi:hypothetical protein
MVMTVEQARKELGETEAKLQELEKLQQRREMLRHFIALGEQLSSPDGGSTLVSDPTSPAMQVYTRKVRTAEVAHKVLRTDGRLHMGELLKRVREEGWAGSGNDTTDKNRLYVAMHRLPKVFKSHGGGRWSVKEEAKAEG